MQHCKQSCNTNATLYAFVKAFEGHEGHEGLASGLMPTDPIIGISAIITITIITITNMITNSIIVGL